MRDKLTNDTTLTVCDLLDKSTVWYTECVLKKKKTPQDLE